MNAVGARSRIMVGVNAESTGVAAAHAAALEAIGVDSLLVFAPSSWAGTSDTEMAVSHHRAIVEATGLPILLFQAAVHAGQMALQLRDPFRADTVASGHGVSRRGAGRSQHMRRTCGRYATRLPT